MLAENTVPGAIDQLPPEDLARIEAVLDILPTGCSLAVDANGRFDVDLAVQYAEALAALPLHWYEEPVDPLDYQGLSVVAEHYEGVIATGENLLSRHEATNLIRYGGLRSDQDVLQMDSALSYGFTEYQRTLTVLDKHGWSAQRCIPHGGHQFNLAIAAGCGLGGSESYPGIFEPFGGFADGDEVENGYIALPDAVGIGLELKSSLRPILEQLGS